MARRRTSTTKKRLTKPKSKVVASRSFGQSLRQSRTIHLVAISLFALVGSVLLFRSFANPLYSSNPNDIVLQYVPAHNDITRVDRLSDAHQTPFTLYGNGLLVCAPSSHDPFAAPVVVEEGAMHEHSNLALTARSLSKAEMNDLVQKVRATGFEQLDSEYYDQLPVSQLLNVIRFISKGSEKDVLYYNDNEPPVAYTQTLNIMRDACSTTTEPYVTDSVVVRARAGVNAAGQEVQPAGAVAPGAEADIAAILKQAKETKQKNDATRTEEEPLYEFDEYVTTVSGAKARALLESSKGKANKFVSQESATYEISVEPQLPVPNNPMELDYKKLRAETEKNRAAQGKSMSSLLLNNLTGTQTASAATIEKYRIIILLPNSGGSTDKLDDARKMAYTANQWTCKTVGKCPHYAGATVIRGSQSQAYYNRCHSTCYGNQLLAILLNVAAKDSGTVYRSDVITIVVPGWKTNTLSTGGTKACGWGMQGGNLSAIDLYQTTTVNGLSCQPLSKVFPHEYLHNLSLGHITQCTIRNLMQGPPGCRYSNNCTLSGVNNTPICNLWPGHIDFLRRDAAHFY